MFALPRLDDVGPEDQTDKARLAQASDDEQDTCYGEQASYGEKDSYGVHFGTMLLACQVIAGNSFNTAYLSHDRKGSHRVQLPPGGILMHDRYFLHVPRGADEADTTSYAVTPNFQQWRFPGAGALPAPWRSIAMTPRDAATSCILSGRMRPEKAHVIPQSHDRWYTDNGMSRYSQGAHSVSNSGDNTFRLRADLHRIFDDRAFTLVPKLDAEGQQHIVVHFFSTTSSSDAALVYHNRKVHSIQFVAPEFLFARFALTVFACIKDFILSGERRRIAVVHRGINSSGNPAWVTQEIEMDRAQRHSQYGGGGSRSSSPSKRSMSEAQQEAERFELTRDILHCEEEISVDLKAVSPALVEPRKAQLSAGPSQGTALLSPYPRSLPFENFCYAKARLEDVSAVATCGRADLDGQVIAGVVLRYTDGTVASLGWVAPDGLNSPTPVSDDGIWLRVSLSRTGFPRFTAMAFVAPVDEDDGYLRLL
ncbi:hypothetical protein NHJ13051_009754 [Beauveria bassiana]